MLKEFKEHIESSGLFSQTDKLLLGVSGGIDSIVLLALLKKAGYDVAAAHCNFGLRGKESEEDERFTANFAKKMGVQFFSKKFETKKYAKEKKVSVQMAAREIRYAWFNELRHEHHFDFILTAHHLNDSLETFLLNFTRGTGILGLTGIPEKTETTVRPLLPFTREKIAAYAKKNKIAFREDSSNYSEKYARNLIRRKVIPALKQLNPSLEETAYSVMVRLKSVNTVWEEYIESRLKNYAVNVQKQENRINIPALKNEKHLSSLLHYMLQDFNFNAPQLQDIITLTEGETGKTIASSSHILIKDRTEFVIRKKAADPFKEIVIDKFPAEIKSPSISFSINDNKNFRFPGEKNIGCFDLEKIGSGVKLRRWKQGDSFQPFGMKGSKKVSDFFVSEKMNSFEKQEAMIMEAGGKIAWIMGRRIDGRFAVTDKTKKILSVKING